MPDSPATLARDLIADCGRYAAAQCVLREALLAETPAGTWRGLRLLVAVVLA